MGLTKTEAFTAQENEIAALAKALGHPARVAILKFLAEHNACVCGDIVSALPLAQATVSQHLKELKQAGLIQGTIEPPKVCYCISEEGWNKARDLFAGFFMQTPNCCSETSSCS